MTKIDFKLNVFSLSERLYPMVARLLGDSNTEDAIQEIMIKLWQKRKKLENHPNINGFVILTARNYCIDLLRKKALVLEDSSSELKVLKSTINAEDIEWKELNNIIFKILEQLPQQQKEVFLMRDVDGYEFTEIAAALSIKIEHVRVLLSRARKQIGVALEKKYDYERGTY
ncbi:RNA polymerase subunit sigma-24 [Polaribacter reichenbachii]|uniref:RNA polymerase subunit sigma-24 n=2 Tax=Polaribacter reichenbachii TaxID=996801 RepID=A0A1B8TYA2_9FLAO|nr:RNA polymerase sigma factor [Polaribacter reichenbachii]APZ45893.1 RNA polymerase subunit sigma-24 [Polaribacter reichenbachii]AUC19755.1 RNA polymerase subunit sigma-24 [Polaribacter reichenbachii]OBY64676.1 RNA polymerase subunit sigma-24 [Polaribacter reichenbachii]